jgi:GNAT superfamily N-acetyltransferase
VTAGEDPTGPEPGSESDGSGREGEAANEEGTGDGGGPTVRPAREGDLAAVMNVLDGAMLAVEGETVADRIAAGDAVLVAEDGGRIVGALVLDRPERGGLAPRPEEIRPETRHVEAVAVRRRRRDQGIGRRLIEAAAERCDYLTADYRPAVREFYEAAGFTVTDEDDDRLVGMRSARGGRS